MTQYSVLIIPSSDDEGKFENVTKYSAAVKKAKRLKVDFALHSFATIGERNAFISGYKAGIGYLGNGLFYMS